MTTAKERQSTSSAPPTNIGMISRSDVLATDGSVLLARNLDNMSAVIGPDIGNRPISSWYRQEQPSRNIPPFLPAPRRIIRRIKCKFISSERRLRRTRRARGTPHWFICKVVFITREEVVRKCLTNCPRKTTTDFCM